MVVYRKEANNLDTVTGNTAAQPIEEGCNEAGKTTTTNTHMGPRAILTSRPNSHPFQDRHLILEQPIKVGRSVARCRPAPSNAIFDCKVLSRNHALIWYENGKFYLQDTKSSNGTFVNNQRLSKGSEESPAREVCSGDIVQFGVDVVENSRKVVHGCIVATLKLYLPDGKEAKASPTTTVVSLSSETSVSSQEIYQLAQYLQEALHREQILENKLGTLQKVVANTQDESDIGWKALIEEDRLLSRIETLENQLQTCGKNVTEEKLKEDVLKLQEEKDKYQITAKESLKKVLQEKLDAIRKVQDLENSLSNTENECSHLGDVNMKKEQEIQLLLQKSSDTEKEIVSLTEKLQEAEDKYLELANQTAEDKIALESNAEEMRKEEQILSTKIEVLQAENDFAKEQLTAMKDQDSEENMEKNGNLSPHDDDLMPSKMASSENTPFQELSCEGNRLELELQKVHKENLKNESLTYSDTDDCTTNGDVKLSDNANKLQHDIQQLKKMLLDARENKKHLEEELFQVKGQLDEAESSIKKSVSELHNVQEQLSLAREHLHEKSELVLDLEFQLSAIKKNENSEILRESNETKASSLHIPSSNQVLDIIAETQSSSHDQSSEQISFINYNDFGKDCAMHVARIKKLEAELEKSLCENSKLSTEIKSLQNSFVQLEMDKKALESKDNSWNEYIVVSKTDFDETNKQLTNAQEEIILIKERYEECNREKSYLQGELTKFKEQLQLLSVQSKTVSVCSIIPLIILAIAMMLAFYPTLAHLTATSDQT